MSADETLSHRADELVDEIELERRKAKYDAFEELAQLVDAGEMTWEQAYALQLKLGVEAVSDVVSPPEAES